MEFSLYAKRDLMWSFVSWTPLAADAAFCKFDRFHRCIQTYISAIEIALISNNEPATLYSEDISCSWKKLCLTNSLHVSSFRVRANMHAHWTQVRHIFIVLPHIHTLPIL